MNIKPALLPLAFLIAAVMPPRPAAAAEPEAVRITAQFFRILGNVSGDTSLTDNIWAGAVPKPEEEKEFAFFTIAKLTLADHRLIVDDKGWHWEDKQLLFGGGVLLIASPTILTLLGKEVEISVSSDQALEYFIPKGGPLYELKKIQKPMGLGLKVTVEKDTADRVHLKDLTIFSRLVETRKPLEGTTLNVGEPVVKSKEHKADLHLKLSKDYGFQLLMNDGQGFLLGRLRVEPASAPAAKSSDKK